MSRISLVTGGNRGLGLAVAAALARLGGTAVIGGRDGAAARSAAQELRADGLDVEWVALDVDSLPSVTAAASQVRERFGRLDVLVNNAGILPEATDGRPHEFADAQVFEQTFRTNVFGAVAVIEAFLPLLRASAAGRIVNVSSTMGSLTDQTDPASPYYSMVVPAYQSSKAALNSITIGLSKKLADTPITVTSVCPGFVRTGLTPGNAEQAPLSAEQAAETVVAAVLLPDGAPSGTFVDSAGTVAW